MTSGDLASQPCIARLSRMQVGGVCATGDSIKLRLLPATYQLRAGLAVCGKGMQSMHPQSPCQCCTSCSTPAVQLETLFATLSVQTASSASVSHYCALPATACVLLHHLQGGRAFVSVASQRFRTI